MSTLLRSLLVGSLFMALSAQVGCDSPVGGDGEAENGNAQRGIENRPSQKASPQAAVQSKAAARQVPPPDFYTVANYDESRNPADDLAMTVERAGAENKHILIQVGGDWCPWCHRMTNFIEGNEAVRSLIDENYLLMKVADGSDKPNEEFLDNYPPIPGHPHLYVLNSQGALLHSQATEELEEGDGYNEQLYVDFLTQWNPASR